MTRVAVILAVLAGALSSAATAQAEDARPSGEGLDPPSLLVKFVSPGAAVAATSIEGDVLRGVVAPGVHVVGLRSGSRLAVKLAVYGKRGDVVYAEPNHVRAASVGPPTDPSFAAQWGLGAIRAVAGWSIFPGLFGAGLAGPAIAVLDTGVDLGHPDLMAKLDVAAGASCISGVCSGTISTQDGNGHGTHVAGIAAAATDNGQGVAGLALTSRIVPVKVLNSSGSGTDAGIAAGISWAVGHGARVINMSLGGGGAFPTTLCTAVANAIAAGVVVVAGAGNSGSSGASYPAACPGAIGVAATDSTGGSPSWSNYGNPNVFVSGPGDLIHSTYWSSGSTYATLSGTSMAAPHVAGLAALLLAQLPTRTPADVKLILASTSEKLGSALQPPYSYTTDPYGICAGCTWNPRFGYGEIDAEAALGLGQPPTLASTLPTIAPAGATVTLFGSLYVGVTAVSLGNVPASFTVVSPTEIAATVPPGVAYGRWRVVKQAGTATSELVTTVAAPAVASFSPAAGPAGSVVTITGSGFVDISQVTYGHTPTSFTVVSPTEITATVPAGVPYGRWRVSSPLWTSAHPIVHTATGSLTPPFEQSSTTGSLGASVTLTGSALAGATTVSLGYVPALFTIVSPTEIAATVPPGVAYGRWRVSTSSGTLANDLVFTVAAPAVASFSPAAGPAGSVVTITGSGFVDISQVTYGDTPTSFTVVSPTEITATVPTGVPYGRWRVSSPLWTSAHPIVHTATG